MSGEDFVERPKSAAPKPLRRAKHAQGWETFGGIRATRQSLAREDLRQMWSEGEIEQRWTGRPTPRNPSLVQPEWR